jgi:hypothetical protein
MLQLSLWVSLARISYQAAQDTDKTLVFWSEVLIVENTVCYSSLPITVQAGLRVRKLALHSNRSYGYAFRSRAALVNTNPAPAPMILVRSAGQYPLLLLSQANGVRQDRYVLVRSRLEARRSVP